MYNNLHWNSFVNDKLSLTKKWIEVSLSFLVEFHIITELY